MPSNGAGSPGSVAPAGKLAGEPLDESLLDELSAVEFEALRWSVRSSDGLTEAARSERDAWLRAAPAHRAAYEEMTGVMGAVDEIHDAGTARLRTSVAIDNAQASSARDVATIAAASEAPAAPRVGDARADPSLTDTGRHWARRSVPHAVAAILALGVLGGGWFGWDLWQRQPVFSQHFATLRGQQLEARLPDGSRLQMDAATQADVTLYRKRREVVLPEGQVLFQVQGDTARPFDVLAGAARITVVGTRFAVRYVPSLGQQTVQVTVLEGKVRVARAQGQGAAPETIELVPGQTVSTDDQGHLGPVTATAPENAAPWLSQRVSFENATLTAVLAELRRYGDIPLRIGDPAAGTLPVTASVDLRDIGGFVRSLPQVLPVRLQLRNGTTEIVSLAP
jgi:transmembrane sensor